MNARLTARLHKSGIGNAALGNLFESIDRMDPTRSHESIPSVRFRNRAHGNRIVRGLVLTLLSAVSLLVLAAMVAP